LSYVPGCRTYAADSEFGAAPQV